MAYEQIQRQPGETLGGGVVREVLGVRGCAQLLEVERDGAIGLLKLLGQPGPTVRAGLEEGIGRLQGLVHPHLVQVHGLLSEDELLGLWTDSASGRPLSEVIAEGPVPLEDVRRLGGQLIEVVGAMHAAGEVHHDLAVHQVFVDDDGVTLDGLGLPADPDHPPLNADGQTDALSNVFTLGVLLYELACGVGPFEGTDTEISAAIERGRFRRPSARRAELDEAVDRAITAALEPDRPHRVPSVETLCALWRGESPVWDQPVGAPMLRETPLPRQRVDHPVPASAGPRAEPQPAVSPAVVPITRVVPSRQPSTATPSTDAVLAPLSVGVDPAIDSGGGSSRRMRLFWTGLVALAGLGAASTVGYWAGVRTGEQQPLSDMVVNAPPAPVPVAVPPPPPIVWREFGPPSPSADELRAIAAARRPAPRRSRRRAPVRTPAPVLPSGTAHSAPRTPAVVAPAPPTPLGVTWVDHDALTYRSEVPPVYPRGERGAGNVLCLATVQISEKGVPINVTVDDCPEPFAASARRSVMRSRWARPVVNGSNVMVTSIIPVTFDPK